ncbi:MAG: agmatine deiminase family protein [Candidatus Cloacimonetes bacterium]|nr:agmatine deiminase family protein [Candidatus Cloacimonadota bacterium]
MNAGTANKNSIIDTDTNYLYLSDLLQVKFPEFHKTFTEILDNNNIKYGFLEGTKDVWAVDYMPIQVHSDKFVKFCYNPDYLRKSRRWRETITDCTEICKKLGIDYAESGILIDGGNVIRSRTKAILTDKIFEENPAYDSRKLIEQIESLLELQVVTIPYLKSDIIGHADGYVRFLDENIVLINEMANEDAEYSFCLKKKLTEAKLSFIEIPYNPYKNKNNLDATGLYINYLQMRNIIFLPVFGIKEDDTCLKLFRQVFPKSQIVPVKSNAIAKDGGVLNCISWNILG